MSYQRPLESALLFTLSRLTPVINVLIGPRLVGKTTIARQIEQTIKEQELSGKNLAVKCQDIGYPSLT